jgi:DNA polymerase I-like protein with 3'-5' exonuclease and polymerase domains
MAELFYREMGMKEILGKKTKSVTTDDEALHRIAEREPILKPVTRKISELRSLGVFHSTFIMARTDDDGRMRTSFNLCGTETYRFSSSQNAFGNGLNFQNIPKGGETEDAGLDLPNVRNIFVPDAGLGFFDIDLDSADLRIVSWESDCQWMKEQFAAGKKPYVEIMKEYYKDPTMSKNSHPREYAMFKSLCHGTNYLGTAQGIAPRIGLLVKETEQVQDWYFGLCPEIPRWQNRIKEQVTKRRFVSNAFGYKMNFFDRIEGNIFNQAVAWIPQSTVGCLINRAWVNIKREIPEVRILLQVHDSLAGTFPLDRKEEMLRRIVGQSQVVIPYADPLIIPVGVVSSEKSWGECG